MDKKTCIYAREKQNLISIPDTEKQQHEITNDAPSLTHRDLPCFIDCYDGLLDELFTCKRLDQNQVQQIRRMEPLGHHQLGAIQLLDDINKLSSDKKEQFLAALDKTQQSHVANYIRLNGKQPATTDDDNWPVMDEFNRMGKNFARFVELLDSRSGLCNELLSSECISFRDKEWIDQFKVMVSRNYELLLIMERKSRTNFKKFIDCLIKTKQPQVAALLDPNIAQNVQLVDEKQVTRLSKNYSTLVQLIDLKRSELLNELLSADVITRYQKDFIESASIASESNERLLDCMKRGSQRDYDDFINCLDNTGLEYVADILRSDEFVVEMVAQTSLSSAEKNAIVEECLKLYRKTSTQKRQQLIHRLLDELQGNRLIALQTQHIIKLFFLCESLSGLLHLNELYCTKKLEIIIQQLFTMLLNEEQPVNLKLKWKRSNYNDYLQNLSSFYGLPVYSQIHQLAQLHQLPDATTDPSVISLDKSDRLPHELIELLIMKAAGILFVTMTKMTTRADVHTLTTLNCVCRYWWETLTCRQSNRQLLGQFFEHSCEPYRFNPKLLTSLVIQGFFKRVAELDDKLYIVVAESNTVHVWSRVQLSFCEVENIKVPEMINPYDILACSMTRCLYISDSPSRCIWRVNLSSSLSATSVEKFITFDYEPYTLSLSVQSNRLLVTVSGRALCIYSCSDGALLRKIGENKDDVIDDDEAQPQIGRLLRYVNIDHAVETTDGRLIVSYIPRYFDDEKRRPSVSEATEDGQVLRTYNYCATGNCRFAHLTMDSRKHVLVCDYEKRQILHLNSELKLQQVLLTELAGLPDRVCFSEQTGLLYISYRGSINTDVYKVTSD